ncbi:anti-sigma factor [Alteromonas halophila]|uniref:Anti-sigma K factor RskA C-terminal domain-containing protein n=1 Tax=Alteromonas halophila TaxID=516698 RepID=A0A918JQE1_9ALTE|nr:anti-sigma factor [Alteromonas halophila]GGW93431.1 hypothetical protein GCM10007391_29750 [Alteromonas halophila]
MNYLIEERYNALAAEYVIGTLRGKARIRFQKLMMQYQAIHDATCLWEQYLEGLNHSVAPVTPPPKVWAEIQRRLGHADAPQAVPDQPAKPSRNPWQWTALTGLAAAVIVALFLIVPQKTAELPVSQVAIVSDNDNQPLWIVEVSRESIKVRVTDALAPLPDTDYELWMVPANDAAPISLGLLPESGSLLAAAPDFLFSDNIKALAVSKEPPGGSPTGSPSEVLYIAPLFKV